MSKERLEEIRKDMAFSNDDAVIKNSHYEWLIEQAERVQELNNLLNKEVEKGYKMEGKIYDFIEQNKRYREALEFYANEDNWVYGKVQHIVRGKKAQKALEGKK